MILQTYISDRRNCAGDVRARVAERKRGDTSLCILPVMNTRTSHLEQRDTQTSGHAFMQGEHTWARRI
jgi:hypothetical protein